VTGDQRIFAAQGHNPGEFTRTSTGKHSCKQISIVFR